ncbi:unnamed protein product [Amoebophrya sp. A25]|nr:unnamed protein product [Amoebophrya sp. A25]|eukprot:GSA25T00012616001.1
MSFLLMLFLDECRFFPSSINEIVFVLLVFWGNEL